MINAWKCIKITISEKVKQQLSVKTTIKIIIEYRIKPQKQQSSITHIKLYKNSSKQVSFYPGFIKTS